MLTNVRDGGNPAFVFEDRDALAGQADNAGTFLRDVSDGASIDVSFLRRGRGNEALTCFGIRHTADFAVGRGFLECGSQVQAEHDREAGPERDAIHGAQLRL